MKTVKFINEENALKLSEELKDQWNYGIGIITGPFYDIKLRCKYWEVTEPKVN
jgi:hypothetical protein